jgi:hypothetical protein
MGKWEHMKIRRISPCHDPLRVLILGRSVKVHREIKRRLFTYWKKP